MIYLIAALLMVAIVALYYVMPSGDREFLVTATFVMIAIVFAGLALGFRVVRLAGIDLEGDRLVADVLDLVDRIGGLDCPAHFVIAGEGRGLRLTGGRHAHAGEPSAWRPTTIMGVLLLPARAPAAFNVAI